MDISKEERVEISEQKFSYYDISPEISERMSVWPGDVGFRRSPSVQFKSGGNLELSSIVTTVHLGAHADAPNHYHPDGQGIETRDLNYYMGPCQVVSVSLPAYSRIRPEHIHHVAIHARRVLFKTLSFPDPNRWSSDFVALSAELISYLSERGVVLVGLDTPSVDLFDDKNLEAHRAIFKMDMAILEGVVLEKVPDGIYNLVALPLRMQGADASPVRAILVQR